MQSFGLLQLVVIGLVLVVNSSAKPATERPKSYVGYSVVRCSVKTSEQVNRLRTLMMSKIDTMLFWNEPSLKSDVNIMISNTKMRYLLDKLNAIQGISCHRSIKDVSEIIKKSIVGDVNKICESNECYYNKYHNYDEVIAYIKELSKNPKLTYEIIGKSVEKRDLYLIKVSKRDGKKRPIVYFDANHHAREWIASTTLIYIMESLINDNMPTINSTNNSDLMGKKFSSHLENYDFWFIPVVNPDGFSYSFIIDRFWRKNRAILNGTDCVGVDLNRNYAFKWKDPEIHSDPCDESYEGPNAFSEPESRTVGKILKENGSDIKLGISLHNFAQMILLPYNYMRKRTDNYEDLKRIADAAVNGIKSVRQTEFRDGVSSEILYPAWGTSEDWMVYSNVTISFGIELPDNREGFITDVKDIVPVGQEIVVGVSAMIDQL